MSPIGSLSHASKVVKPTRSFLRRIIELSKQTKELGHFIRLNKETRSDIEWWYQFTGTWNGISLMNQVAGQRRDVKIIFNASGGCGCAALFRSEWLLLKWPTPLRECHMVLKELVPIVLAAALWGKEWTSKTVMARCDNAAVVAVLKKGLNKEADSMQLLWFLSFIQAKYQFN